MPRHARRKAAHFGQGGEDRRIARATREYHVGAGFQRALPRLDAHHADDVRAAVDHCVVEFRRRMQRLDASFGETFFQIGCVLLGVDQRDFETQFFCRCNFLQYVVAPGEVNVAAGGTDGAHQQRNLQAPRAEQHQAQIAFHRSVRKRRLAIAEMARARIGRAAVAADEVRLLRETQFEGFFGKPGAAYAGRCKDADFCIVCFSH